jgi:hypothetical protein
VFTEALGSGEYVLVRNALRVLARMVKVRRAARGARRARGEGALRPGLRLSRLRRGAPALTHPPASSRLPPLPPPKVFPMIDQHALALARAVKPLESSDQREVRGGGGLAAAAARARAGPPQQRSGRGRAVRPPCHRRRAPPPNLARPAPSPLPPPQDIKMAARRYLADLDRERKAPNRMLSQALYGGSSVKARPGAARRGWGAGVLGGGALRAATGALLCAGLRRPRTCKAAALCSC